MIDVSAEIRTQNIPNTTLAHQHVLLSQAEGTNNFPAPLSEAAATVPAQTH
jgi:hypothetical protein